MPGTHVASEQLADFSNVKTILIVNIQFIFGPNVVSLKTRQLSPGRESLVF